MLNKGEVVYIIEKHEVFDVDQKDSILIKILSDEEEAKKEAERLVIKFNVWDITVNNLYSNYETSITTAKINGDIISRLFFGYDDEKDEIYYYGEVKETEG